MTQLRRVGCAAVTAPERSSGRHGAASYPVTIYDSQTDGHLGPGRARRRTLPRSPQVPNTAATERCPRISVVADVDGQPPSKDQEAGHKVRVIESTGHRYGCLAAAVRRSKLFSLHGCD